MSGKVALVARVGDEEIPLGTCNPAQARILVKKDVASWMDGKLLILARPAFLKLAERGNDPSIDADLHWKGSLDNREVSVAEMDRRKAWFREFMSKAVPALAVSNSDSRHIPVHRIKFRQPRASNLKSAPGEILNECTASPATQEEIDAFNSDLFNEFGGQLRLDSPYETDLLASLWDTVPNMTRHFPSLNGEYCGDGLNVETAEVELQEAVEVIKINDGPELNTLSLAGGRADLLSVVVVEAFKIGGNAAVVKIVEAARTSRPSQSPSNDDSVPFDESMYFENRDHHLIRDDARDIEVKYLSELWGNEPIPDVTARFKANQEGPCFASTPGGDQNDLTVQDEILSNIAEEPARETKFHRGTNRPEVQEIGKIVGQKAFHQSCLLSGDEHVDGLLKDAVVMSSKKD